jgi:hypothetical protein
MESDLGEVGNWGEDGSVGEVRSQCLEAKGSSRGVCAGWRRGGAVVGRCLIAKGFGIYILSLMWSHMSDSGAGMVGLRCG